MWDAWAMAMTCIARWSKALPGADILPVLARSVIFPHALNGMPPRPTAANMRLHSILPNNNQRILESANGLGFSQARSVCTHRAGILHKVGLHSLSGPSSKGSTQIQRDTLLN